MLVTHTKERAVAAERNKDMMDDDGDFGHTERENWRIRANGVMASLEFTGPSFRAQTVAKQFVDSMGSC